MFAFSYSARDKNECKDEDGYGSSFKNSVTVTVVAESPTEALAKVKNLAARDDYKLNEVEEMAADGHTIRPGSW